MKPALWPCPTKLSAYLYRMKRSDINPMPVYFDRYINLVADIDLVAAIQQSLNDIGRFPLDKWTALGDRVYAPGKWTIKDMLQHIIDTERIFTYRALRFARNDSTVLPGFEEDDFANAAQATARPLEDLLAELTTMRQSSLQLFGSFTDEMLQRTGKAFKSDISVLALGFTLVGHQIHHLNVLAERYYPLLED
jgi:DinB superfamily